MEFMQTSLECRLTRKAAEYKGTKSHTASHRSCQRWDSMQPHQHSFRHSWMFSDGNLSTSSNFCRNPGAVRDSLWCFTSDPQLEWEYCNVPMCGCRFTSSGSEYVGGISRTSSGRSCQRWDYQHPHPHKFTDHLHFQKDVLSKTENFCRNPDAFDTIGPWCYTQDPLVRWEYCNIPFCECKIGRSGSEYSGKIHRTKTGKECQRWNSQFPHKHDYLVKVADSLNDFTDNFCRNPDPVLAPDGPWCLTTDPNVRWEYCSIGSCELQTLAEENVESRQLERGNPGGRELDHGHPGGLELDHGQPDYRERYSNISAVIKPGYSTQNTTDAYPVLTGNHVTTVATAFTSTSGLSLVILLLLLLALVGIAVFLRRSGLMRKSNQPRLPTEPLRFPEGASTSSSRSRTHDAASREVLLDRFWKTRETENSLSLPTKKVYDLISGDFDATSGPFTGGERLCEITNEISADDNKAGSAMFRSDFEMVDPRELAVEEDSSDRILDLKPALAHWAMALCACVKVVSDNSGSSSGHLQKFEPTKVTAPLFSNERCCGGFQPHGRHSRGGVPQTLRMKSSISFRETSLNVDTCDMSYQTETVQR